MISTSHLVHTPALSAPQAMSADPRTDPAAILQARFAAFASVYAVPLLGPNRYMNAHDAMWGIGRMRAAGAVTPSEAALLAADVIVETSLAYTGQPPTTHPDPDVRLVVGAALATRLGLESEFDLIRAGIGIAPDLASRVAFEQLVRSTKFVDGAITAAQDPVQYVRGAVRRIVRGERIVEAQAHTVPLDESLQDDLIDEVPVAVGIDCDRFLRALRASDRPRDVELALEIARWLHDGTKGGDNEYQRMRRALHSPRFRALALNVGINPVPPPGRGVIAVQPWFWENYAMRTASHRYSGSELVEYGRLARAALPIVSG